MGKLNKEFLAILFACNKFYQFIYGQKTTVQTDHLPLISLMKKYINQISSKRLQRIKLKLSIYDIEVVHVAGKEMYAMDAISRACSKSEHCETIPDVNQVVHTVNMSITIKRKIQEDTNKDNVLLELKNMYKNGWPNSKTKVPEIIQFFFNQSNNIYVEEELVFLENRIIVPRQ